MELREIFNIDSIDGVFWSIMNKLPTKKVLQSKCVCKRFCSLIEERGFSTARSASNQLVFSVCPKSDQGINANLTSVITGDHFVDFKISDLYGNFWSVLKTSLKGMHRYSELVGLVEGVVCYTDLSGDSVCMLNVTTQEISDWIPNTLPMEEMKARDPVIDRYSKYLFGYDIKEKFFKVLCITIFQPSGDWLWQVLRYPEATWKTIKVDPVFDMHEEAPVTLYYEGYLYMYVFSKNCKDYLDGGSIFSFDLATDDYDIQSIPDFILGHLGGVGYDYQTWIRLVEIYDSIGIVRRVSSNELKFCVIKDITKGIHISSNWKVFNVELPVASGYMHSQIFFDVMRRRSSELLLEIHHQTGDDPERVTFYTLSSEEFKKDWNPQLRRLWKWEKIEVPGFVEVIDNSSLFNSLRFRKMVFPFKENFGRLKGGQESCKSEGMSGSPGGETVYRLLCPKRLLGRDFAGDIQTIKRKTGAKIKVDEPVAESFEVVICISSPLAAIRKVDHDIYEPAEFQVPEEFEPLCPAQDALLKIHQRIALEDAPSHVSGDATARLLVQHNQVGCLIGLGGQTIQMLRTVTGASIRISDCVVQIYGSLTKVKRALYEISTILQNPRSPKKTVGAGFHPPDPPFVGMMRPELNQPWSQRNAWPHAPPPWAFHGNSSVVNQNPYLPMSTGGARFFPHCPPFMENMMPQGNPRWSQQNAGWDGAVLGPARPFYRWDPSESFFERGPPAGYEYERHNYPIRMRSTAGCPNMRIQTGALDDVFAAGGSNIANIGQMSGAFGSHRGFISHQHQVPHQQGVNRYQQASFQASQQGGSYQQASQQNGPYQQMSQQSAPYQQPGEYQQTLQPGGSYQQTLQPGGSYQQT